MRRSHSVITRWVFLTAVVTMGFTGCVDDETLEALTASSRPSGPQNRAAKKANVSCYDSFPKFKSAQNRAGEGMQWHHIVGQHSTNEKKFGKHDLNCTDNVIRIPTATHRKLNGHYSSKQSYTNGKTVRAWLASSNCWATTISSCV